MSWWTGAALGFDTETDGPEPDEARIITMATVLVTPDNPAQEIEVMVQPERDIPQGAIDVHGITTERAREEGALREMGIAQVALTIAELVGEHVPLVGHNVSYDLTLLDREMRRLGIGHLKTQRSTGLVEMHFAHDYVTGEPDYPAAVFPVIDTYVLDKALDRYRKGKRQLSYAAEFYGCPMKEGAAHGATADVYASLRIAYKIHQRCRMAADYMAQHGGATDHMAFQFHPFTRLYGGRREPMELVRKFASAAALSLLELHRWQQPWAIEQAKGLREHFMESGTGDPDGVDGRWPLRPLDENETIETISTTLL